MNVELVSKTEIEEGFLQRTLEEAGISREELPESLTEALLVYIARVSSSRENRWEDHYKLIRYLIDNRHWSPFEHAFLTFEITTSRAIGRQLLRHRSFTFQEFSQRYQSVTDFEDIELRKQAEKNRQSSTERLGSLKRIKQSVRHTNTVWSLSDDADYEDLGSALEALDAVEEAYLHLLDRGVARETARMILPECTQTTIYMSGPLRSWIHFLDLRDDRHAQKEIQVIAQEIQKDVADLFPNVALAAGITPFNIGQKAVCQHGREGEIHDIQVQDGRLLYLGNAQDGENWQSVDPQPV